MYYGGNEMLCPNCGKDDHGVTKTIKEDNIHRHRFCNSCGCKWTTEEKPVSVDRAIPFNKFMEGVDNV